MFYQPHISREELRAAILGTLAGFVRLHILHHAAEGQIYGTWIIEVGATRLLAQSGYALPDAAHDGEEGLSAIAAKEIGSSDPAAVTHDRPRRQSALSGERKVAQACWGDVSYVGNRGDVIEGE